MSSVLFKAHFNLSSLLFPFPFTPANLFLKMLIPYLLCLISFKSDMCRKAFIVHHRYKNTFLFLIYNVQKQILNTSQIFQYQPPTVMPLSILSVVPHIFLFHDPQNHSHFFLLYMNTNKTSLFVQVKPTVECYALYSDIGISTAIKYQVLSIFKSQNHNDEVLQHQSLT